MLCAKGVCELTQPRIGSGSRAICEYFRVVNAHEIVDGSERTSVVSCEPVAERVEHFLARAEKNFMNSQAAHALV